ncbi:MAG: hypothetical protein LUH05_00915 [Candidatus Gastranaerophilales bacterium]|nr:hypothetical protein [Candidatus Gastranaerophilales bacterium]
MRINSITADKGYLKGRAAERSECGGNKSVKRHNMYQNNNDQINTTIKSNSDGRVSFNGGVPLLHRAASFTSDNPLVAEALFAILITCGLRPVSIMATAKTDEEKDKCTYQAAKSISSGLMGLGLTALVGTPVAAASKAANKKGAFEMPPEMKEKSKEVVQKGVTALNDLGGKLIEKGEHIELAEQIKNLTDGGKINLNVFQKAGKGAEKLFKKTIDDVAPEVSDTVKSAITEQRVMNNYAKTGKNVIDKLFQPVFMPIRAKITIALVPVIIGLFGIKKAGNKSQNKEKVPYDVLNYNVFQTSNEKELFNSFSGVAGYENK